MNTFRARSLALSLVSAAASAGAFAAGVTPIVDDRGALRSALSGYITAVSAPGHVDQLTMNARNVVLGALTRLAEVTTPQALAALPDGLEIPCAVSGSMRARMAPAWPRMVRFEWIACASDVFNTAATLQGPAEVVLAGNSFTAAIVLSVRLGDRSRDLVSEYPITDSTVTGGWRNRSNLRITGVIPVRDRDATQSWFLGRFAYEVTGFLEATTFIRDRPNPGPPFYPQVITYSAERVIEAGEVLADASGIQRESRLLSGVISFRSDQPLTPTRLARTRTESYRPRDLRTDYRLEYVGESVRRHYAIDGRAEVDLAQTWGFSGCTVPESYHWRTREELRTDHIAGELLDAGELVINDKAVATFRVTGTDPFVDMQQHVDLEVRGAGNFSFAAPFSLLDLIAQAGCLP